MLHKFTLKRKAIDLQIGAQSFMERVGSTELVVARPLWRSSFLKLVVVSTIVLFPDLCRRINFPHARVFSTLCGGVFKTHAE